MKVRPQTTSSPPAEEYSRLYKMDSVGGAIAVALRKEFLQLWACSDPASLSVVFVDAVVDEVAPPLIDSFLEVTNRQVPDIPLEATSFLPEAPTRDVDMVTSAATLAELQEELQGILGSYNLLAPIPDAQERLKQTVAVNLHASHPWQRWLCGGCPFILPPNAALDICTILAPALLAARQAAAGNAARPDIGCIADEDQESLPIGAPQAIARAMRCRRRVFALERELVAREQADREREAFSRAEREKSEARLMEVNHQLEERLKARTEELRRVGQKIIEAQRRDDDSRSQLTDHKHEIARLKYQLEQDTELRREAQVREQEHTRSLLRSAARENIARERTRSRIEQLRKCVDGVAVADILEDADAESGPRDDIIDQIETEFAARIQRRKEQYDAVLEDFQRQIDKKRQEYDVVNRQLKESNAAHYKLIGSMDA